MPRFLPPVLLVLLLAAACSDDTQGLTDDDPFIQGDPADPVICVGDPDSSIVCKKQSDFWDCTAMPNGDEKCTHNEPVVPNGSNSWECNQEGDKVVCKTNEPDAKGGADWSCTTDGEWTTCEKDAPAPPGGEGNYTCEYEDNEFTWSCTGEGPPPPTGGSDAGVPSTPQPPGGGNVICFEAEPGATGLPTPPEGYWAKIIAEKVLFNGVEALHAKVIFSKAFVDNTYGAGAMGYADKMGAHHSFNDLKESDKAEVFFNNSKGDLIMHMAIDYISNSSTAPSGYGCLGVSGGDGQMIKGDEASVLGWQSSLSVNFNQYGYVLDQDSPITDENYTPDPAYPNWIWEVWYEVWVDWAVYGGEDPGKVYITGIHASPSKTDSKTLQVVPGPCP